MSWQKTLKAYRDPPVLRILFLGFSSGLPFLLTLATLHVWLLEAGLSKTTIGIFAAVTLPYSFKFLWAPVVDSWRLPFFCSLFGQRKGWMIFSQIALMISLIILGRSRPEISPFITAAAASNVAFWSATQDIVIEAFRIEALNHDQAGLGAGASSTGYRLGMWISGAGALYLASAFSWSTVYLVMAFCMIIGLLTTLLSDEPGRTSLYKSNFQHSKIHPLPPPSTTAFSVILHRLKSLFGPSLKRLFKTETILVTLLFIFLFKVGDTVLNTMTMPFLLETGFSKIEIAHVAKSFGIAAAMLGSLVAGVFLVKRPLIYNLILCCSLQIVASLMFMIQARLGHHLPWLFFSMGVENFACGMATASYLVFVSSRCTRPFTGTHFALLCSFGSFCRIMVSSVAGWAADQLIWQDFYFLTALLCLPALLLLGTVPGAFQNPLQKEDSDQIAA
mgnify:CR=1 FL=1|tara:strand:- start:2892 stop:4232 length:1341 start_codon:yes stop_codon:yes gene_type:complete